MRNISESMAKMKYTIRQRNVWLACGVASALFLSVFGIPWWVIVLVVAGCMIVDAVVNGRPVGRALFYWFGVVLYTSILITIGESPIRDVIAFGVPVILLASLLFRRAKNRESL